MRYIRLALLAAGVLTLCALELDEPRAGPRQTRSKAVDVFVVSDGTFVPGSRAAVRVMTKLATSMTRSRPLAGAKVAISLSGYKSKTKQLFSGRSGKGGSLDARFTLPNWPDGSYQIKVAVQSRSGEGTVQRAVQLRRGGRVLLTTDKPIYQPRQTINMRALALSSHDLRPLAWQHLRFEVLDPKGNKVFKRVLKTDGYGIAATTFDLADEINHGNYQIEVATVRKDLAEPAAKTVVVKKYVLPKFKVGVKTDRKYYLPKQTIKGSISSDYFFGKPVAGGGVTLEASTFDGVSFKKFATLRGKTDDAGKWSYSVRLPGYFVGQPLLKGNALVRLAIKVKDSANHTELGTRSLPVAAAPIRLTALPEGGRLVLDVKNQIYVVATYPDGSPARATVTVRHGKKRLATVKTDEAGLATVWHTPRQKGMRNGAQRSVVRFGRHVGYSYTKILNLAFEAKDARGNSVKLSKAFSTDPEKDHVLLRTNKAIYRGGDVLHASVLANTRGADTVFVDLIKNRQTLLTRQLRLRGGKAKLRLPLSSDSFGTLELHAYTIDGDGQISRDGRVLYVQPSSALKVSVLPNKKVYRPGEKALIRFRVTDASGEGKAAALGLIVVDEAVYALQELKPGLEKVYFTLERELSKPKYQIEFGPADSLQAMIKADELQARRQQVAKVLLAKAKPLAQPGLWQNPDWARGLALASRTLAIRNAIHAGMQRGLAFRRDGRWVYRHDLVWRLLKKKLLNVSQSKDPFGARYSKQTIEKIWPDLRADRLIPAMELQRLWQLRNQVYYRLSNRTRNFTKLGNRSLRSHTLLAFREAKKRYPSYAKDPTGRPYSWGRVHNLPGFRPREMVNGVHAGRVSSIYYAMSRYARQQMRGKQSRVFDKKRNLYKLPAGAVAAALRKRMLNKSHAKDIWGQTFRLRRRAKQRKGFYFDRRLRLYDVISAGADRRFGSDDDLVYPLLPNDNGYKRLARRLGVKPGTRRHFGFRGGRGNRWGRPRPRRRAMLRAAAPMMDLAGAGGDDMKMAEAERRPMPQATPTMAKSSTKAPRGAAAPAAPKKRKVRVRNYFPETLLFKPALITDGQGNAQISLKVADSITTWRMTASANSKSGELGATSHALRVFQDFFVDLDLPVSLTQNDEVSVPVVVYNYLKKPQRVRLTLKQQGWFSLTGPAVQELTIKPSEVAATYYRIKVRQLGRKTLQVQADGSAMSDAIRREIEVLPDGKERNLVASGRLAGTVQKTLRIPKSSVDGASKILVRLYPGVFSQVIEGMESMLRLPGG